MWKVFRRGDYDVGRTGSYHDSVVLYVKYSVVNLFGQVGHYFTELSWNQRAQEKLTKYKVRLSTCVMVTFTRCVHPYSSCFDLCTATSSRGYHQHQKLLTTTRYYAYMRHHLSTRLHPLHLNQWFESSLTLLGAHHIRKG